MPLRIPKPDFDPMVRMPSSLRRSEEPGASNALVTRWVDATKPEAEAPAEPAEGSLARTAAH
jgi:hypothetical protein